MTSTRLACVVPALNAAPTLAGVVTGLRAALPPTTVIVVVDDGSRDETHAVASAVADTTLRFRHNRGKGAALRAGFASALERGADALVTIDADGQHDPRYAPALVESLATADLVLGARDRRAGSMPVGRRLTNLLSAAAVRRCIGQPVADAQCGFRAMRAEVVGAIAPRGDRYEFETEFLILAALRGYRVGFVSIPTQYASRVPSQFRPVRDSARIIGTLLRFNAGASA